MTKNTTTSLKDKPQMEEGIDPAYTWIKVIIQEYKEILTNQ